MFRKLALGDEAVNRRPAKPGHGLNIGEAQQARLVDLVHQSLGMVVGEGPPSAWLGGVGVPGGSHGWRNVEYPLGNLRHTRPLSDSDTASD